MKRRNWILIYVVGSLSGAAVSGLGRVWDIPALGLPADFWAGFLMAAGVLLPLAVVGGIYLTRLVAKDARNA